MSASPIEIAAAVLFAAALVHTFTAKLFERLAHRHPRHAGLLHLLGEVEIVFGFWAAVLIVVMALMAGGAQAVAYAESRQYTEPLFVFVVMVVAASRPVLESVRRLVAALAQRLPLPTRLAQVWLSLALNLEANLLIRDRDFAGYLRERLQCLMNNCCREVPPPSRPRPRWWSQVSAYFVFRLLRRFPHWVALLPRHRPQVSQAELAATPVKSEEPRREAA